MKEEHKIILNLLSEYLTSNPDLRFGQALFNLRINEFTDRDNPEKTSYSIRDIHGDRDDVMIQRIQSQLNLFDKK